MLGWKIARGEGLVVVRGVGVFDLAFVMALREAVRAEGAVRFGKLLDLSRAHIALGSDDIQAIIARICLTPATASGPVAIVVGSTPPPLLLDMAVLLKNRIGDRRRLRVFVDEASGRQWLSSAANIVGLDGELARLPFTGSPNAIWDASLARR